MTLPKRCGPKILRGAFQTAAIIVFLNLIAPAHAAQFYIHHIGENAALVTDTAGITTNANGMRGFELASLSGGVGIHSVDISKMEADCGAGTWRTISEFYYSLPDVSKPIDKTHLNEKDFTKVKEKTVGAAIVTFICGWPNVTTTKDDFLEGPDIWTVGEGVGRYYDKIVYEQIMKEEEEENAK